MSNRAITNSRIWQENKAFTLLELIATMAVMGIVLTAFAVGFHERVKNMNVQLSIQTGRMLSDNIMDEIRSRSFTDPQTNSFGAEEASPRANFDDVDDYDGWSESPPKTIEGADTPYEGFTRSVSVVNVLHNDCNASVPEPDGSTSYKRIEVVVTSADISLTNISVVSEYD